MLRNVYGLTDEQIRKEAPSVFATEAFGRSNRYLKVRTPLALMREAGLIPTFVTQSTTRIEGKAAFTKHLLRFRKASDQGRSLIVGDEIHEITLRNSHDGTSSYELGDGIFRLVCSNGLMRPINVSTSRFQHKASSEQQIVESTLRIIEEEDTVRQEVEVLKHIPFDREEQLLLAEVALRTRLGIDDEEEIEANTPFRPANFLRVRVRGDNPNTAWGALNVVQYNGVNKGLQAYDREHDRAVGLRELKGIDSLTTFNRTIYRQVLQMALAKVGVAV